MIKKVMLSFATIPLAVALCLSSANAIGVSEDAQKRSADVCKAIKSKKVQTEEDKKLLAFCDGTTFHCTTHRKGGIFGMVKGVCDSPDLCKDATLRQACQTYCVDNRRTDDKTRKITEKLAVCPVVKAAPVSTPSSPDTPPVVKEEAPPITVKETPGLKPILKESGVPTTPSKKVSFADEVKEGQVPELSTRIDEGNPNSRPDNRGRGLVPLPRLGEAYGTWSVSYLLRKG